VAENNYKYAFIVPNGHYEFLRRSFELCIALAYFQKYINAVFANLAAKNIITIYMDDLIIPSVDYKKYILKSIYLKEILEVTGS